MTNQEFIALAKKNPISFGCALASIACVVGLYFRDSEIPEAEAELTQKTAQAERFALNIQHSAQLKEQAEIMTTAVKELDTRLVRPSQLGINTGYFYKVESDTGVKIVDLRQNTPSTGVAKSGKNAFVPVAFAVTVQGTLPQVLDFLRQLENGAHYSRTITASCTANTAARGVITLALGLELLGLP
jgi:hypothetical protein